VIVPDGDINVPDGDTNVAAGGGPLTVKLIPAFHGP
jgi:hypothetical protein